MPIEIRELQITAVVQDNPSSLSAASNNSSSPQSNDAVVAACVEKVLEILQQKNER